MQYIQNTLLQNENTVYWTRPHWIIFKSILIVLLIAGLLLNAIPIFKLINFSIDGFQIEKIILLFLLLICGLWFAKIYLIYRTSEYGITNKRVLMKYGWIARDSLEVFLDKIEAVRVDQTFAGRIFNYGTLTIIGTGGTKDEFFDIPDPFGFRKMVQQQIDLSKIQKNKNS